MEKIEVSTYRRVHIEEQKAQSLGTKINIPFKFNFGKVQVFLANLLQWDKLLMYSIGFFLGRMLMLGEYSPFVLPYFVAISVEGNPVTTIITGIFITIGYLNSHTTFDICEISALVVSGALLVLLVSNLSIRARKRGTGIAFLTFVVYLVTKVICAFVLNVPLQNILFLIMEAFFTGLLTLILLYGMHPITNRGKYIYLRWEEMCGLMLLVAGVIAGLPSFDVGTFSMNDVLLKLVIMTMAFVGGAGVGTIGGVALGILFAMVNSDASPLIVGLYACGGLIAGLFRDYGKPGIALGLFLGNVLLSFQFTSTNAMISSFSGTALAAAGFALLPKANLSMLERYITNPSEKLKREAAYQKKLRMAVSERLEDFSSIFVELAKTFESASSEVPEMKQRRDVVYLLNLLSQRACQGCKGYQVCWEKNFHHTYKELLELLIVAERKSGISGADLPEDLRKHCIHGYKLVSSINYLVEVCKADKYWRNKLSESQEVVSDQLKGVAKLMGQLSNEVTLDAEFKEETEARILARLKAVGIPVKSITAVSIGDQELEVTLCKKKCKGERDCMNRISPLVSNLLGRRFTVWKENCALETGDSECEFRLLPARSFEVEVEAIKASRGDGIISGDNYSVMELKNGKIAFILSDGMGSGLEAALESGATVGLMERLMNAGFDSEFAVQTINSILLLRSAEEIFATVDMAILDLYTGKTEFIKIGAAPGFIKRGRHIEIIRGTSLPVGILNSVNPDSEIRRLKDGDIMVMMTDGFLDSCRDLAEREEWMGHILERIDSRDPKEIARLLLRAAREKSGGNYRDDMTIIVVKVKNKFSLYKMGS